MNAIKTSIFAAAALLASAVAQAQAAGCGVIGGWPGAQYGMQAQLITDSIPCYGITGTKGSPIVLQGAPSITAPLTVSGASASALVIGRQGITSPAFVVDTATGGTTITGITVTAESTGNGVNISATGETNVPLIINGNGSGTISLGTSSTGSINLYRSAFILHDSNPTLTLGLSGGSLAHLTTPGTSGVAVTTGGGDQVKIIDTPSATRQITMTGSNGGNPTIATTAGSLAITPAVVGAGAINGSMAANSIKCNNTGSPATSIDCTPQQVMNLTQMQLQFVTVTGVNFNAGNTDTTLTLPSPPTGFTRYTVRNAFIDGPSASLNPATIGIFTATGGGGVALVASGTAVTVTSTADSTINNMQVLSPVNVNTMSNLYSALTSGQIFFRVQTASSVAATASVSLQFQWLP